MNSFVYKLKDNIRKGNKFNSFSDIGSLHFLEKYDDPIYRLAATIDTMDLDEDNGQLGYSF